MFYAQDGLAFERDENGNVEIKWEDRFTRLTPAGWASVVAAVCKAGESGETHQAALDFHEADGHVNG